MVGSVGAPFITMHHYSSHSKNLSFKTVTHGTTQAGSPSHSVKSVGESDKAVSHSCNVFKKTFENTPWRKVKQMSASNSPAEIILCNRGLDDMRNVTFMTSCTEKLKKKRN